MKINSLKQELSRFKLDLEKKDDEILLVQGQNFEINQRVVRIVEEKDAPHGDYMLQMLNQKLQPLLSQLPIYGVVSSGSTSQQGGKRVRIAKPYFVPKWLRNMLLLTRLP